MSIVVVGGMDRLNPHYQAEARSLGIDLRIFNRSEKGMGMRLGEADALVLFTGKVSHRARREVMAVAKKRDIPVRMCHSCGLCALRECLEGLCALDAAKTLRPRAK